MVANRQDTINFTRDGKRGSAIGGPKRVLARCTRGKAWQRPKLSRNRSNSSPEKQSHHRDTPAKGGKTKKILMALVKRGGKKKRTALQGQDILSVRGSHSGANPKEEGGRKPSVGVGHQHIPIRHKQNFYVCRAPRRPKTSPSIVYHNRQVIVSGWSLH